MKKEKEDLTQTLNKHETKINFEKLNNFLKGNLQRTPSSSWKSNSVNLCKNENDGNKTSKIY